MRCLSCKHCHIDFGQRGYSPETPGENGVWECRKGVWEWDYGSGKEDIAKAFAAGETCRLWESDGRALRELRRESHAVDALASVIAGSRAFQRATGTQDADEARERIATDDGSSVTVMRRIAFRIASPPCDGWYDVRWSPADAWQRVWLARVIDEATADLQRPDVFRWVWGHDPTDDPESLALDVSDPLGIEWRHAQ